MRSPFGNSTGAASVGAGKIAVEITRHPVEQPIDGKSDADDSDWFGSPARDLLGPKPGTALHYATGFPERDCQRYAAGHVRPPGYFVRALLRSDMGWQFLSILMDGSGAVWWAEVVRARRIVAAIDREL